MCAANLDNNEEHATSPELGDTESHAAPIPDHITMLMTTVVMVKLQLEDRDNNSSDTDEGHTANALELHETWSNYNTITLLINAPPATRDPYHDGSGDGKHLKVAMTTATTWSQSTCAVGVAAWEELAQQHANCA
ncbi:hypothetical protein EDB85DRAFT_1901334 [Lactarius pseudohatsudake]|nr:hypothetical protein EDB85DRAFT_1901334 [Lactarius pseudohatsudake]